MHSFVHCFDRLQPLSPPESRTQTKETHPFASNSITICRPFAPRAPPTISSPRFETKSLRLLSITYEFVRNYYQRRRQTPYFSTNRTTNFTTKCAYCVAHIKLIMILIQRVVYCTFFGYSQTETSHCIFVLFTAARLQFLFAQALFWYSLSVYVWLPPTTIRHPSTISPHTPTITSHQKLYTLSHHFSLFTRVYVLYAIRSRAHFTFITIILVSREREKELSFPFHSQHPPCHQHCHLSATFRSPLCLNAQCCISRYEP